MVVDNWMGLVIAGDKAIAANVHRALLLGNVVNGKSIKVAISLRSRTLRHVGLEPSRFVSERVNREG